MKLASRSDLADRFDALDRGTARVNEVTVIHKLPERNHPQRLSQKFLPAKEGVSSMSKGHPQRTQRPALRQSCLPPANAGIIGPTARTRSAAASAGPGPPPSPTPSTAGSRRVV